MVESENQQITSYLDDCTDSSTDRETGQESAEASRRYLIIVSAPTTAGLGGPVTEALEAVSDVTPDEFEPEMYSKVGDLVSRGELDDNPAGIPGGGVGWSITPDRDGVDDALDVIEVTSSIKRVVVDKIVTLGRTPREIRERAARVLSGYGCDLVLVEQGLHLDAGSDAAAAHLDTLTALDRAGLQLERETTVDDLRRRGVVDGHGGRPPIGFDVVDGELRPNDRYAEVCGVLELARNRVVNGPDAGISKGEAARRLDSTRRTINRALDRKARYGLDE